MAADKPCPQLQPSLFIICFHQLHSLSSSTNFSKFEKLKNKRQFLLDQNRYFFSGCQFVFLSTITTVNTNSLKNLIFQEANEALKHHSEESFSRLVVSMEEKFEESLKAEKEQMEVAFKLKAKDHDLYDRLASSPVTTRSNSRRASLVKISSMSDLLALKAPTLDSLESMGPEQVKQKFIVLMDHFYAAVDEIRALRARLSKAQDTIDAMEIDKLRFEESFKRTIVMQEQQENLMSKRIQDLTNKLLVSEKAVRQLKERKHSRKHSIAHAANHRQQHHIQATHSDSGTTDT